MEAKLREIITDLLKVAPDREGGNQVGNGRKSKTTVLLPFPTLVQEDVFDAKDESDYLMVLKCTFLSVVLNLNGTFVTYK